MKHIKTNLLTMILFAFILTACNNNANKNQEKTNDIMASKELNYYPQLPINSELTDVQIITNEAYFEVDEIIDESFSFQVHIDYANNNIKIAVPTLTSDEDISVFVGEADGQNIIDIQLAANPTNLAFDAISYLTLPIATDFNSYLIRLFSNDGNIVLLNQKIIENEDIFNSDIVDYAPESTNTSLNTYALPAHFKDFFENDSCFFINKIERVNDTAFQFEIFDFADYEQEISSITYEFDNGYLLVKIIVDENTDITYVETKLAYLVFDIDAETYNGKDKIKIEKRTASRKARKTISKSVNKGNLKQKH